MTDNPYSPTAGDHGDPHPSEPPTQDSVGELMGHPKGLFFLFFAELWERFSFYGMRALLVLYLSEELFSELLNPKDAAFEVFAAYGALVYFTPAIGGMLADRVIGHKNSIMLGAILMCMGHFTMAFQNETIFYLSLGLLIVGNGFFKPNISSLVGGLYAQGDVRRDAGFTIFYLGINLGAFLAPLLCGFLGEYYGWHYGFGAAGIGMLAGLFVFWYGGLNGMYGDQGEQPADQAIKNYANLNIRHWVYLLSFLSVPLFAFLVRQSEFEIPYMGGLLKFLLIVLLLVVLVFIALVCIRSDKVTRERLIVISLLTLFVTIFWAFFEQAGSSLTLFAKEQVRLVGMNASMTNAINPFYIIVLAIPFSMFWNRLESIRCNPNTMVKFGLGIFQLGLGFLVFALSSRFMDETGKVSMLFLLVGYLLLTSGELFLSPIGLSKVTELSPAKLVSFMMGVWFLSSAFAHYIAGGIAKLTSGGGSAHGGEEAVAGEVTVAEPGAMEWVTSTISSIAEMITGGLPGSAATPSEANLLNYTNVFAQIAIVSFIVAAIALIISPVVKRMMHGVR